MLTPGLSVHPDVRLAISGLVTSRNLSFIAALGAVLAVSACDGMEVGSVPHCTVLQTNCSDFGTGPETPTTTAVAAAPRPARAGRGPVIPGPTDAVPAPQ